MKAMAVYSGKRGIGKTTLAIHLAHLAATRSAGAPCCGTSTRKAVHRQPVTSRNAASLAAKSLGELWTRAEAGVGLRR